MSFWSDLLTVAGYFVGAFTGNWWVFAAGLSSQYQERAQRRAQRRAIDEYNASLKDRLEMVDLMPDAPRSLVLGRVRYVEGVRRRWVSGTNSEKLTMVVSYAGHEIDAFEQWYIDDKPVTLNGSGWVTTAPWYKGQTTSRQTSFVATATTATVDLGEVPDSGSVSATWTRMWTDYSGVGAVTYNDYGQATITGVAGSVVSMTGLPVDATVSINYQVSTGESKLRIRAWNGTAGQNVGAAIAAEYPGKISASDRFAGIAVAVIDMVYDQDVFAQGRPNVTCVMRGAKVLDPRTSTTAWSENPALCAYHYARWSSGYGLPADEINTADIIAAANACDVSTTFTLRAAGGGTSTVTLPRYRCGITITSKTSPREAMDDILASMAGRSGWAGGVWRMRAGVMASPAFDVTPDWLASPTDESGQADPGPVVRFSNGITRDGKVNRVTGTCVDPDQRWQSLPFPAVQDSVLVAAQGEYQAEVVLPGVNHIAHAQHLGTVMIRENQAALRGELSCNLNAYRCELFDVGRLLLPRYGMTEALGKTVEVIGWRWHPTQGVQLTVAEISPDIYTPVAELTGRDPAPNSVLPPLGEVEQLTITGVTSGTEPLTDGSVITRTRVAWGAAVGAAIRANGQIEVQYTEATATLPTGDWPSWIEGGTSTSATIPGLRAGRYYAFRVRALKPSLGVRGPWSAQKLHKVADAPAVDWSGIVGAGKPADNAGAVVSLVNAGNMTITGNTVRKTGGGTGWTASVYSRDSYSGGAYVTWSPAQADKFFMVGLNTDPAADNGYASIDFAIEAGSTGQLTAYESGSSPGVIGTYAAGDVLAITYDGVKVRYMRNGAVLRTVAATITAPLFADSSFYSLGAVATNLAFGPLSAVTGIGTGQMVDQAVHSFTVDEYNFGGLNVNGMAGEQVLRTVSVTPAVDCKLVFSAAISAARVQPDSGYVLYWKVSVGGVSTPEGVYFYSYSLDAVPTRFQGEKAFNATGGVPLVFTLNAQVYPGAPTPMVLYDSAMSAVEFKR